jgi:hypothetical protein
MRLPSALIEAAEEGKELEDTETAQNSEADKDLHSLERKRDRTLYFLAKKNREQHAWQFRMLLENRTFASQQFADTITYTAQGGVEKSENLVKAALRELHEEFGTELDVWQTGILPAAFHAYPDAQPSEEGKDNTKVRRLALIAIATSVLRSPNPGLFHASSYHARGSEA